MASMAPEVATEVVSKGNRSTGCSGGRSTARLQLAWLFRFLELTTLSSKKTRRPEPRIPFTASSAGEIHAGDRRCTR
jgi:hypothetical protein